MEVERAAVEREVDALASALAEERFRHVAGMDPAPALVEVFAAHGRAAHQRTAQLLREAGHADLAERVARLRAERVQAEHEEAWRRAEAEAVLQVEGFPKPLPLAEAELAVASEGDRARRLALGAAVASCAAGLAARDAAAEVRARARAEVGIAPDWDAVVAADALLAASDDGYREVLAWLARREAGLAPAPRGDLTRADLLHVVALRGWAGLFPRGMLAVVVEKTAAALRLDLSRVRVDDGVRPAQWPGAHALGRRVSLRRQGGAADWLGLFDAAGRALAWATVPEHRRQPAAPATFGALLAGLLLDRGFLAARLDLEKKHAGDLVRALALRQLFRLRAAAAALRVATEVERGSSGAAWHEAHREALSLATLASWPAGLAGRDADADPHRALLQGAARAEVTRRQLVERHDEDWWKNPRAADDVGALLAQGGAWGGDEPAAAVAAGRLVALMG